MISPFLWRVLLLFVRFRIPPAVPSMPRSCGGFNLLCITLMNPCLAAFFA
jgi:hypothetical protein